MVTAAMEPYLAAQIELSKHSAVIAMHCISNVDLQGGKTKILVNCSTEYHG
jgi:hypothetical protein